MRNFQFKSDDIIGAVLAALLFMAFYAVVQILSWIFKEPQSV